jgi:PAS domain S-box-containing protein
MTAPSTPFPPDLEALLLDQVDAAVIVTDLDGVVIRWTRGAERMYGWSAEEALGRHVLDLTTGGEDRAEAAAILDQLRAGGAWEGEVWLRRKDGARVAARVRDAPLHAPDGRRIGIVGVSVDVGDRRAAEARLATQYAVTRALAESTTLDEAGPRMLRAICEGLEWSIGLLWLMDRPSSRLRLAQVWRVPGLEGTQFEELSRRATFAGGIGLPGRVYAAGAPIAIPDAAADPGFTRAAAAGAAGLHGALAFPILRRGAVLGVLEFLGPEVRQPDEDVLAMVGALGIRVGLFMERSEAQRTLRERLERERAMLTAALDCIITMDERGTVIEFNPAAERTFGWSRDEAVGSELAELIVPPALRERHRAGLARFLATGEGAILGRRVELTGMRRDGSEFPVEVAIERVKLEGASLFIGFLRDVSERRASERERARLLLGEQAARSRAEAAQERLAFLAEASMTLMDAHPGEEERLARLAHLAVPRLGDWCAVHVLGPDGAIRPAVVVGADPSRVAAAQELFRRYPPDPAAQGGVVGVIRSGRTEHVPELPDAQLVATARDEEHLRLMRRLGLACYVCAPLRARGRTIGALTIACGDSGRRLGSEDVGLVEELARRAALAVDNARLFEEQRQIAQSLQESLLPPLLPEIPGIRIAARYQAGGEGMEVGGDFYDIFETGEETWAVVIGDVCGKGPHAAALAALARYALRAAGVREQNPAALLTQLNEVIVRREEAVVFLTAICACLETTESGARLVLACAGHPPPLVLRVDGRVERVSCVGSLLGVFEAVELGLVEVELAPGDLLVLYTDGVLEARGPDGFFGVDRLARLLRECIGLPAPHVAERVERAVIEYQSGQARDDVAVLVLEAVGHPEAAAPRAPANLAAPAG